VRYIGKDKKEFVGMKTNRVYGIRKLNTVFYVLNEDANCGDERIISI